jgi:hypothetical protein
MSGIVITQDADTTIEVTNQNTLHVVSLTIGETVSQDTHPKWGNKSITVSVSVVTDDNFKKNISPIIWIDQSAYDWQLLGAVQDTDAGTLDFSACTSIGGEVYGTMRYQYWD